MLTANYTYTSARHQLELVWVVDVPLDGTRRERVTITMTRLAAAFEELIADAPDQWWAIFFPIWPDLEAAAGEALGAAA